MCSWIRWGARIAVGLAVLLGATVSAAADIDQIEACMRANVPKSLQVKTFELIATDRSGGTRMLSGRLYGRLDQDLIEATLRIELPADLRGAAYLVREAESGKGEDMFVYLPALQKVRRISGGMKDSPLFGTDLSYADVKQIAYAFTDDSLKLEREDRLEERPMWVLSMSPTPDNDSRFDRVEAWIDQQSCMVIKADFMQAGEVRKRFVSSARHLAQSGPHWYVSQGRIEDLQAQTHTDLRIVDVFSGQDLADRLFNPRMFYLGP
ncbi:outer membrane lipoprotein-sorting protein [Panacagrimonas sp.]|uniref:outer membrane lipoprotein-sorting protein n=1 Tax=Panacagrimonas sp. TaxID=2480088 RepID=UPI003B5189EB